MNEIQANEIRGGYSYFVTEEQIEEFQKLPLKERLRWLEEYQEFTYRALSKEEWETLQKFRSGEI
jgi:hypothetical protein